MDEGEAMPCAITPHLIMNLFYYVCTDDYIQIDKVLLAGRNARSCSKYSALSCGKWPDTTGHFEL